MNGKKYGDWRLHHSEKGEDLTLFKARYDTYTNRRNGQLTRAVVLQAPDWVNVVALTPEECVVIVRQFRFGTREVTSEIPAGIVEAHETPQQAAVRELREETGYTSKEWKSMEYVEPNPAFLDNKCYLFLARNAQPTQPPQPDPGENIRTVTMDLDSLKKEMESGRLRHSLALAALTRVFDFWTLDISS